MCWLGRDPVSRRALYEIPENPDFLEKLGELRRLLQTHHVPSRVKDACLCLSERQKELFVWVAEVGPALGASRRPSGLYATDLLSELIEAIRALDWPKVVVLIHGKPPKEGGNDSIVGVGEGEIR